MHTKRLRFIMVGGFLGAGKTTTLARLARFHTDRGQKVGIVTNDQADNLVDTTSLRSQGFPVQEVPGACFCCRFDDLVGRVAQLESAERPDVILAEPVGSCTDLVATVVQPLKDLYGNRFEVAPYAVLFKPSHGLKILQGENRSRSDRATEAENRSRSDRATQAGAGFSPKAAYIFCKQLEEADAIVINRIDELSVDELNRLQELVAARFPVTPVLKMSARTGAGFDTLTAFIEQQGHFGRKILDIDYDTYAEGEAELGWLNSSWRVEAQSAFSLDTLLLDIVARLQAALAEQATEVAHLKAIGLADATFGVANLVASGLTPELSLPSRASVRELELIVNARVAVDPAVLQTLVRQVIPEACLALGARAAEQTMQSFRPGRPQPTHRYATAVTGANDMASPVP